MTFKGWEYYQELEKKHRQYIESALNKKISFAASGYFPDFDIIIDNMTIEIKTEMGGDGPYSNNMVIELENTRYKKVSGINATKADIWSNTYYYNGQWYIGMIETYILKKFVERGIEKKVFPIKTNNKNGDNNAKLAIIKCKYFHNLIKEYGMRITITDPKTWVN